MEILKTKKKMEKEDSSSQATFTVRGKQVSDSSISRFERRAKKRGILPAEDDANAAQAADYQAADYQDLDYQAADYQLDDYQGNRTS